MHLVRHHASDRDHLHATSPYHVHRWQLVHADGRTWWWTKKIGLDTNWTAQVRIGTGRTRCRLTAVTQPRPLPNSVRSLHETAYRGASRTVRQPRSALCEISRNGRVSDLGTSVGIRTLRITDQRPRSLSPLNGFGTWSYGLVASVRSVVPLRFGIAFALCQREGRIYMSFLQTAG